MNVAEKDNPKVMHPFTGAIESLEVIIADNPDADWLALGHDLDGHWLELPYVTVKQNEEGRWTAADGSQVPAPLDWQRKLVELAEGGNECSEHLAQATQLPNHWDTKEGTSAALRGAAANGYEGTCKLLMDAGADIHGGFSPLHHASAKDHIAVAHLLLEAGANPNAPEDDFAGLTSLHLAAGNVNPEIGELLLRYGADPTAKTREGHTCMEYAQDANNTKLVAAFKEHEAHSRAARLEALLPQASVTTAQQSDDWHPGMTTPAVLAPEATGAGQEQVQVRSRSQGLRF